MTDIEARVELRTRIRAPREKVFAAWTTPDVLARWIAPGPASVAESMIDLRVGGTYRLAMRGEMGGYSYDVVVTGLYERIIPNELLSFTWTYVDDARRKAVGHSLVTITLTTIGEDTELTLVHTRIATAEKREGHRMGWIEAMEKLAALVEAAP
jgi:uncharacterized protein YndB with AHSA1/START domain